MIRPAVADDVSRIISMGAEFWAQTLYAKQGIAYSETSMQMTCRDMLSHRYSAGMPLLWVAEVDGCVVGSLGLAVATMYANFGYRTAAELWWWIDVEHRKGGMGFRLLRAVQDAAKAANMTYLSMMILEGAGDPDRAAAMYLQDGFVPAERTFVKNLQPK